jgi:hypothetical protein
MLKLLPKIIVVLCILSLVNPLELYSNDVEEFAATKTKTSTSYAETSKSKSSGKSKSTKTTKTKTSGKTSTEVKCNFQTVMKGKDTWAQKCANTKLMQACAAETPIYNYFKPFMCTLGGNIWLTIPLIFLVIYVIFKFITALVDEYICPSIEYIKEQLNMSEALAGVTLLALANGAGDVITAIVASGSDTNGVSYNIGALFGAGFFVCSMVICLTI